MKCPKCPDKELATYNIEGVDFDFCSPDGCKGVWCDKGELAYYLEVTDDLPSGRNLKKEGTETKYKCTNCGTANLIEVSYLKDVEQPKLDVCPECRGIWLDFKELSEVKKLATHIDTDGKIGRTLVDITSKLK